MSKIERIKAETDGLDVLPELLPLLGIADDAGVAVWLLTSVSTATGLYLRHERDHQRANP